MITKRKERGKIIVGNDERAGNVFSLEYKQIHKREKGCEMVEE